MVIGSEFINEAIRRLKALNVNKNIIKKIEKGIIQVSFNNNITDADMNEKRLIRKIESKFNCYVYHLVKDTVGCNNYYSFLFIDSNVEKWDKEVKMIKELELVSCYFNKNKMWNSDLGCILFKINESGGIINVFPQSEERMAK